MQDMDKYTVAAAIGMWRCGATNIEISEELNLCVWEVEEIIENFKTNIKILDPIKEEKITITVIPDKLDEQPLKSEDEGELFNPDSKSNWLV